MKTDNENRVLWRLILLSLKDLTLAVLLGTVIFLPFYAFNETYTLTKIECDFTGVPDNDSGLIKWYRGEGFEDVTVERREKQITINYRKTLSESLRSTWPFPDRNKLDELGYGQALNLQFSDTFAPSFNIPSFIPPVIICSQIGFLLLGLWRIRKLQKAGGWGHFGINNTSLKNILVGFLGGVAIISFGLLYDLIFKSIFGSQPDLPGIWQEAKTFSFEAKLLIVLCGTVIAPICEEVFFRGGVFGSFAQKRFISSGILFSSALFAAVHFDLMSFPVYFVFGVILAFIYLKTRSLVPSIIAHAVNNAVAFYLIYAW